MNRKILLVSLALSISGGIMPAEAHFNTIRDKRALGYEILKIRPSSMQDLKNEIDTVAHTAAVQTDVMTDSIACQLPVWASKDAVRKKHLDHIKKYESLPDLTINNLLKEIRKNGIKHEKIVLAQAILETGWFTSNVCRNKNNLFGLTNPRTGKYYEFDHWTESVKAYYTKVQYRYKGGNYLLWLDEIGYAENKTYVQSLIRLLEQYFY